MCGLKFNPQTQTQDFCSNVPTFCPSLIRMSSNRVEVERRSQKSEAGTAREAITLILNTLTIYYYYIRDDLSQ